MKRRWIPCLAALFTVTVFLAGGDAFADSRVIQAGTEIIIRTDAQISIGNSRPGDIFPARIDEDVYIGDKALLHRGDPAEIRLIRTREDSDELSFRLHTITVKGRRYEVRSDTAREVARREAPQQDAGLGTAGKALLGAAGGAAIGGAVGGKKGALIGAATGAGGGLIWAGAGQRDASVPAGTPLEFTLRDDVVLKK